MKIEVIRENKSCPQEFVDFLIRIGGLNRYGQPNFKLTWGQTDTKHLYGQMEGGYCGQHVRFKYHGIPAWHLEQWEPPEYFGSPEDWYAKSWDAATQLHTMGDYPFRGDYVCRILFYTKHFEQGKLIIDSDTLKYEDLELLVPAIWEAKAMSRAEVEFRTEQEELKKRQAWEAKCQDAYKDGAPAFGGADFSSSVNRERMLSNIRANRNPISYQEIKKRMGSGHSQVQL